MTCLLLTSSFLACVSARKTSKNLMHSTDHYVIKETSVFKFTTTTKKIMHMNNALFTDILMLCNRKDATNQTLLRCAKFENIRRLQKISFSKWSLKDWLERLCIIMLERTYYNMIFAFSALSWVLFKKSLKTLCASLWKVSALLFRIITLVVEFSLTFCSMQTSTWQQFMSNASSFKIKIWDLWRISWWILMSCFSRQTRKCLSSSVR